MKLQFINNIGLDIISGGNIYNKAIIAGLRQNDVTVAYNSSPLNEDYDISIVDSLCMNTIALNKLNKNKPIVSLIHQLPKLNKDTLSFYKSYSKFIVTGEPTKEALITHWYVNDSAISVIRPGVSETWQPKLVFQNTPKQIIIVSNFIEYKGFELLVQILNRLKHLNLKFDIVGNNELDKVYAESIITSIKNTKANVSFHFNLNRNECYDRLINADAFLSLSKYESFGIAVFEALTLGLPCLAYKTGDHSYFERYSNYVGLDHYSEASFSEIIEDWVHNPVSYKIHCNTRPQNRRHWKQVVDEFLLHLKTTMIC